MFKSNQYNLSPKLLYEDLIFNVFANKICIIFYVQIVNKLVEQC